MHIWVKYVDICQGDYELCMILHADKDTNKQTVKRTYQPKCKLSQVTNKHIQTNKLANRWANIFAKMQILASNEKSLTIPKGAWCHEYVGSVGLHCVFFIYVAKNRSDILRFLIFTYSMTLWPWPQSIVVFKNDYQVCMIFHSEKHTNKQTNHETNILAKMQILARGNFRQGAYK